MIDEYVGKQIVVVESHMRDDTCSEFEVYKPGDPDGTERCVDTMVEICEDKRRRRYVSISLSRGHG